MMPGYQAFCLFLGGLLLGAEKPDGAGKEATCHLLGVQFLYPQAGAGWQLDFGQMSDRFSLQYRIRVRVGLPQATDYRQPVLRINGQDYTPEEGLFSPQWGQESGRILKRLLSDGARAEFEAPVNWRGGQPYTVRLLAQREGDPPTPVESPEKTVMAPPGGYWDARWRHYLALGLTETAGLDRPEWPVEVTLAMPRSQCQQPEREVRVVALDPVRKTSQEVVSQAWLIGDWTPPNPSDQEPTRTINVAFLAALPARKTQVYAFFFDNPQAPEPHYETDLKVAGESPGGSVENRFFTATLSPKSGQLLTVRVKEIPHRLLYFKQGPIHWNPDVYSPGLASWSHTMDWNPPPHRAEVRGPVLFRTTRWGPMPQMPQVSASVTYTFLAGQPFIQESSLINVDQPVGVTALRNNELVFSYGLFSHVAWREENGGFGTAPVQSQEKFFGVARRIGSEDPWMAFYHPQQRQAMACLNLKTMHRWNQGAAPVATSPFFYCADWGLWGRTPQNFLYMTRWVMHSSHFPQEPLVLVPAGSWFAEESAFVPFALNTDGEVTEADFRILDETYRLLRHPIALLR